MSEMRGALAGLMVLWWDHCVVPSVRTCQVESHAKNVRMAEGAIDVPATVTTWIYLASVLEV